MTAGQDRGAGQPEIPTEHAADVPALESVALVADSRKFRLDRGRQRSRAVTADALGSGSRGWSRRRLMGWLGLVEAAVHGIGNRLLCRFRLALAGVRCFSRSPIGTLLRCADVPRRALVIRCRRVWRE